MKTFILFSCLLVVAYGLPAELMEKYKAKVLKFGAECKAELGTKDDDIQLILSYQAPTTEEGKCFVACISKKLGFIDASDKVDKMAIYKEVEAIKEIDVSLHEKFKTIATTCEAEFTEGPNICESMNNVFLCLIKEEKALGIKSVSFNQ